jgi:hypothetical protein
MISGKESLKILFTTIFVGVMLTIAGNTMASDTESPNKQGSIKLLFKMDPRVTRSMYMGERWISPTKYVRVGESKECTVETRYEVFDTTGKKIDISPEWISTDPEMVTVKPVKGNEVNITVKRAGESKLKVSSYGVSKELIIKAEDRGDIIQVEILQ